MGLDMFLFKMPADEESTDLKPSDKAKKTQEKVHYWRKNRFVHNYMETLFREKGGDPESAFNCDFVRVTQNDLLHLQELILSKDINKQYSSTGFFWGDWDYDDEMAKEDLTAIAEGLFALRQGYDLYYDSWW